MVFGMEKYKSTLAINHAEYKGLFYIFNADSFCYAFNIFKISLIVC